jgi:hypothetical protein
MGQSTGSTGLSGLTRRSLAVTQHSRVLSPYGAECSLFGALSSITCRSLAVIQRLSPYWADYSPSGTEWYDLPFFGDHARIRGTLTVSGTRSMGH